MRVVLNVRHAHDFGFVNALDDAFADHRDTVRASHCHPLYDRGFQHVADRREAHLAIAEFLTDHGQRGTRRLADS